MPDQDPHGGRPPEGRPTYTRYRAKPRFLTRAPRSGESPLDELRRGGGPGRTIHGKRRKPLSWRRVLRWFLIGVAGWILLSVVLFLISAQIQQGKLSGEVSSALGGGGVPPIGTTNVLVLGSDQRTKETKEPGASTSGPSRSDSILLMRVGGGHNSRLSIPRDTIVDIPGHGRDKINAAFAIGGPALAVTTVEQYLGIEVNHLVEVSFENFPQLIDAMGGIDYTGGCVVSKINGGFKNGGFTLRLRKGTSHLNGKQALALARTRKNLCNKREDDRTRARRQQKIFSAMKSRLTSPGAFIRLPFISWNAPKAIQSDMSGPTLMGLFSALAVSGTPQTRVLRASGTNGSGLIVDEATKKRQVRRFLDG